MLHAFVGFAMLHLVPKIFHLGDAWVFALMAPALVMTTALSVLSFHYFETPARRYFSTFRLHPKLHRIWETSNIRFPAIDSIFMSPDDSLTQNANLPDRSEWLYRRLSGTRADHRRP
jgi:hypothetical protein